LFCFIWLNPTAWSFVAERSDELPYGEHNVAVYLIADYDYYPKENPFPNLPPRRALDFAKESWEDADRRTSNTTKALFLKLGFDRFTATVHASENDFLQLVGDAAVHAGIKGTLFMELISHGTSGYDGNGQQAYLCTDRACRFKLETLYEEIVRRRNAAGLGPLRRFYHHGSHCHSGAARAVFERWYGTLYHEGITSWVLGETEDGAAIGSFVSHYYHITGNMSVYGFMAETALASNGLLGPDRPGNWLVFNNQLYQYNSTLKTEIHIDPQQRKFYSSFPIKQTNGFQILPAGSGWLEEPLFKNTSQVPLGTIAVLGLNLSATPNDEFYVPQSRWEELTGRLKFQPPTNGNQHGRLVFVDEKSGLEYAFDSSLVFDGYNQRDFDTRFENKMPYELKREIRPLRDFVGKSITVSGGDFTFTVPQSGETFRSIHRGNLTGILIHDTLAETTSPQSLDKRTEIARRLDELSSQLKEIQERTDRLRRRLE
ncbi:MAG: hypothetical protein KDD51_11070, partial [Bdellovibrionales bacterium]|nr:hypothetical protein [Bdellovibrionales bacterium]